MVQKGHKSGREERELLNSERIAEDEEHASGDHSAAVHLSRALIQAKYSSTRTNDDEEQDEAEDQELAEQGLEGPGGGVPGRGRMEAAFGEDFGDVRVHVDDKANEAAESLGADAYTSGKDIAVRGGASNERLMAHELAHVVQQRQGVQRKDRLGDPDDEYEEEAERAADAVSAGESVQPIAGSRRRGAASASDSAAPPVQARSSKSRRKGMTATPWFDVKPERLTIDQGESASVELTLKNPKDRRGDPKFRFASRFVGKMSYSRSQGFHEKTPEQVVAVKQVHSGRSGAKFRLIARKTTGTSKLSFSVKYRSANADGPKEETTTVLTDVTVHVSSPLARAGKKVEALESGRGGGGERRGDAQIDADRGVVTEAQKLINAGDDVHKGAVEAILNRVRFQIGEIRGNRTDGYTQAITYLNGKGLTKSADVAKLGVGLSQHVIWLLALLVPKPAAMALDGLRRAFQSYWAIGDLNTAASAAAMGHLSSPLSGESGANVQQNLLTNITKANADICDAQQRRASMVLADVMSKAPPRKGEDMSAYLVQLEIGLRHVLFGEALTGDGQLASGRVVEQARQQLLQSYILSIGAISGGKLKPVKGSSGQSSAFGAALGELGGPGRIKSTEYGMLVNQLRRAAGDLGCAVDVDEDKLWDYFSNYGHKEEEASGMPWIVPPDKYTAKVTAFDPGFAFRGSPSRWMNPLHIGGVVDVSPDFDNSPYLSSSDVKSIDEIEVRKEDLSHIQTSSGKLYSASKVYLKARGSKGSQRDRMIKVDVPSTFTIIYRMV